MATPTFQASPVPGLDTTADTFLTCLIEAGREAFETPLSIWTVQSSQAVLLKAAGQGDGSFPGDGGATCGSTLPGDSMSTGFGALLAEAIAGQRPRIVAHAGRRLLLMSVPATDAGAVVAVAEVEPGHDPWLLRLARLFVEHFTRDRERSEMQRELQAYAGQVTNDLEELTFLRGLADCLEIGDTCAGRWQTAQSVLPFLRPALKAEAVALVVAEHRGRKDDRPAEVGPVIAWAGRCVIDEQTCRRLIDEFRESVHQPTVRNRLDQPGASPRIPGLREFVLTAIVRHGELYGWLVALNRQPEPLDETLTEACEQPCWGLSDLEFGSNEASLLAAAASVFAACARNADLLHQKENLLVGVVRALAGAIDARDHYTFGHSERVGLIAQLLGEQLALGRRHCRRLYLTGLLHDIGKIGISDKLLRKPGKLSRAEFEQVKRHTDLGCSILKDLRQLSFVLAGVRHHHERFDGTGYPDGLVGEATPLEARIIGVADAYDAMLSDRPYRRGMPEAEVERILREGAGTQWDAAVVEALFSSLDEIRMINRAYQAPRRPRPDDGQDPCAAARASVLPSDVSDIVFSPLPPP